MRIPLKSGLVVSTADPFVTGPLDASGYLELGATWCKPAGMPAGLHQVWIANGGSAEGRSQTGTDPPPRAVVRSMET